MLPKSLATATLAALLTAGCGVLYKQPIYQGNLLESDALAQLQPGLSQQQVLGLLGTPSISDPFHHDRWDYTSSQRLGRTGRTEVKNLTLWFEGGQLARWEGDYFPDQNLRIFRSSVKEFGRNPPATEKDRARRRR